MAIKAEAATVLASSAKQPPRHPLFRLETMDPKQKFHRHFQDAVGVLQDQISQLPSVAAVGSERQEAIDHILAGIAKLQEEVADAAEFTPSYDRRQYTETVKGLQDTVYQTVAKVTPKSRFQFKRGAKAAATTTQHVDMGAPVNDPRLHPGHFNPGSAEAPSPTVNELPTALGAAPSRQVKDYNAELASAPSPAGTSLLRRPSFTQASAVSLAGHANLHVVLPPVASKATSSASLTDIRSCVIDMSAAATPATPFQGLALRDISDSVVVVGKVDGPVHITAARNSVLVMTARQVRIHECDGVDVYLLCGSHPIIEDCRAMRFAPLPAPYMTDADQQSENQWDQVDDFKWLKAGPSPNWTVLSETGRLGTPVWTEAVSGKSAGSVADVLRQAGITRTRRSS